MHIHTPVRILTAALLLAGGVPIARCEVRLPGLLSSHMVLQREKPVHVWGWSDPGEKITVELHGVTRATAGNSTGNWSVFLPPEQAGGPFQLTVSAGNKIVLDDVLIGDVWFASGQSNMEMPLKGFTGAPLKNSAHQFPS
jgi:sialate O-acetylesterase